MSSIKISNLSMSYTHKHESVTVLNELNLNIEQGEFVVVLGASGTGKSTLLRLISGLEKQERGHIAFDERIIDDVPSGDRNVGMVFQSYALYPHLTVRGNIAFGIRYREQLNDKELMAKVDEIAEILELQAVLEYFPRQLSGGQQQRVAIGRALIATPKVLLFDEPLSNVDSGLRTKLRQEIAKYQQHYQTTTLYVTHDQEEAMTLADRIVVMNHGRVEQIGTPRELYEKPRTQFVASFLGSPPMNFLKARIQKNYNGKLVANIDNQYVILENDNLNLTSRSISENQSIVLGIRPEHVCINKAGMLKGVVRNIDYLGPDSIAYIKLNKGSNLIQVKVSEKRPLSLGENATLLFSIKYIHLFDISGKSLLAL
ncbi:ABC transporter ATP-binding protein [Alteromonadaceae bacterium M269]|nr:ABC transporter ATP-binding protein [Alteromonadaceae bacterium M269]